MAWAQWIDLGVSVGFAVMFGVCIRTGNAGRELRRDNHPRAFRAVSGLYAIAAAGFFLSFAFSFV